MESCSLVPYRDESNRTGQQPTLIAKKVVARGKRQNLVTLFVPRGLVRQICSACGSLAAPRRRFALFGFAVTADGNQRVVIATVKRLENRRVLFPGSAKMARQGRRNPLKYR